MKATGSRAEVMHGEAKKTTGGLPKSKLVRGKDGSIKSKAMKKRGKEDSLKAWRAAVAKARKNLGIEGFVALSKDTELYKAAKKIYNK
jgi:hypothetical protein|tara:strand:- start:3815 stop:4078 length:264 start_codon:yes stop_codon:yes gene_type:complete